MGLKIYKVATNSNQESFERNMLAIVHYLTIKIRSFPIQNTVFRVLIFRCILIDLRIELRVALSAID